MKIIPSFLAHIVSVTIVLAWCSFAFCSEIHDAAENGDLKKVKVLLKSNPDLIKSRNQDGDTPLHIAAINGEEAVARLLLADQADVDATNTIGCTPLHLASDAEVTALLLKHGAHVNAKKVDGCTPLHVAAILGKKTKAQLLLANKADVNAKDVTGSTPLHLAVVNEHRDVVEVLLANKADVNARDKDGETPLGMAMHFDMKDEAEVLRNHGGKE